MSRKRNRKRPIKKEAKRDLTRAVSDLLKDASDDEIPEIRDILEFHTERKVLMRTAKASVFTDLFSEAEYQRALYEALTGEKRDEDEFRTITLENYLIGEIHNDLGFLVGKTIIVLCEAQSSWSLNIVYRMLCYLILGWRRLENENEWDAFAAIPIPLPKPKLYVLYTGSAEIPEMLKLSEVYFEGDDSPIEFRVTCLRGGRDGDILQQYKRFTEILDEVTKQHGRGPEAAAMIIEQCKQEGVLVAYMEKRGDVEMIDMLSSVFNEERAQRIHMETVVKEKTKELTEELENQKKQVENQKRLADKERLNAIVTTCLNVGLNEETILQQLAEQGKMDRASAETFLRSYAGV